MKSGEWLLTHQGIAFDCHDRLIDGHHTLWAILISGKTVDVMVTRNLRPNTLKVIDTGKPRTLQDRLTLCKRWGVVTREEAACLKRMIRGQARTKRRSPSAEYRDWAENVSHVRFAVGNTKGLGPGLKISAIRAVIALAHKEQDEEKIHLFCFSLKEGSRRTFVERLRGKSDADTFKIMDEEARR